VSERDDGGARARAAPSAARRALAAIAACVWALGADAAPVALVNPGFESTRPGAEGGPEGWTAIQHAGEESYDFALDSGRKKGGTQSLRITRIGPEPYGTVMQVIDATPLAGKTVRLSAWMRTEGIPESGRGGAGLVLTAMRGSSILAHDFMKRGRLRGDTEWRRVSVELALPARTTRLEAGATLEGAGTAWVDDFELEVVER